jgi:hypothetical protein
VSSLLLAERLETRRLLSAYYVDAAGSDAADGLSPATAWASVNRVNSVGLAAGDSVAFAAGQTFAGTLAFNAADAGSAADPIEITSYGDADHGRATLSAGNGDGLSFLNTSGFEVSNLNVVGSGAQAPASYNGIEFDNDLAGNVKLPYVRITDVDVSGFGRYGISVGGSNGKSGFADVRIDRVDVHHNTLVGIETHGVFSAAATTYANADVYVGHAIVHDNPGYANSPNHSGDGIVLSDVDGATIERSVAYENGAANTHAGGPVGIWVWDANRAVIQHNESHHNRTNSKADGGGFDLDGGVTNSVVQYNYSHDNAGAGFGVYQFSGARPFKNDVVRYNISANDARKNNYAAIDVWNGGSGISNVDVHNNTVYLAPSAGSAPTALRFQTGTTNVTVRDNVFQTTGGVRLADIQAKQTNLQIQGNDYWSSGAAFGAKAFAKTYTTFAAFVKGSGYEKLGGTTVGLNVDPKLANPAAVPTLGDADLLETGLDAFRLQSASPLRDAALNLWSRFAINPGPADFFGRALPADSATAATYRYDLGAAEYA